MKFTPKTEKELNSYPVWDKGDYSFEVIEAKDTTSQKGNDMIVLDIKLFDGDKTMRVRDYLGEWSMYKIKHLCEACGLTKQYEAGEIAAILFENRTGKLKLDCKPDDDFPNSVKDYIVPVDENEDVLGGDEIPF